MKQLYKYLALAVTVFTVTSCDKDFEEINTNPVQARALDPSYLLANAQFITGINTINYQIQLVQQMNTPYTGVLEGGNHNVVYDPNSNALFNTLFAAPGGAVVLLTDVINQTRENAARSNLYNMARIMKAYTFQVLVDTYGDVPYSEAGKGFLESIYLPAYDDHETIYDDLLKELSEASNALDASKAIETQDIFFKGDIAKWKKLGYSLLLRVAMRYSKVNENKAKEYAVIAVNGGLMTSNDDNALIAYNATFNHPTANNYQGTERGNFYLGKPFVDALKNTQDPRLSVIAVKYEFPANTLAQAGAENTTPADQQGMPFGYNESTIINDPNYPGKSGSAWKYSQLNRRTLGKVDAPEFLVTYAQTKLLLAEVVHKGWVTGSAATHYNEAVKAHMQQLAKYGDLGVISGTAQDAYLTANPFNSATALDQINTQYWIASFLNGSEAWSNFRRSGFPALAPNPYPSVDPSVTGGFVHRLVYPVRERSVNTANYDAAVARMGPDNLGTRLFWDQ